MRRRGQITAAVVAASLLVVAAACDQEFDTEPIVTDTTEPWHDDGADRVFTARIVPPADAVVESVRVLYTRHVWPGEELANEVVAEQVGESSEWRAVAPIALNGSPDADHLFYRWVAEYTDGSTSMTARSAGAGDQGRHEFVIGCTDADTEATLEMIADLASDFDDNYSENPTYSGPAHLRPISLENQGVPFARPDQLAPGLPVDITKPALALFHPSPQAAGESDSDYLARITDLIPDPGSRLAGVGWGVTAISSTRRPSMECLPSSRWFMHEAGIHTFDGLLTLYPNIDEDVPGEQNVSSLVVPADWPDAPPGVWHPRLWDVHFWFVDGGVVEAVDHPDGIPGAPLPSGSFFEPETFE